MAVKKRKASSGVDVPQGRNVSPKSAAKKRYVKPELKVHGAVEKLTAGSGASSHRCMPH
ncbi:MAG: hypothetical protein ABSB33_04765 [Tepidisphaeraceae bacterium]|jgi:hypothetical protein